MTFFTDHKRPPKISSPLDWASRNPEEDDPVEQVAVGLAYEADVPRPPADLYLVLSYFTKIGTNLGRRTAEEVLWPSLHEPSGTYEDIGPIGWVELEVIEPEAAPRAPTRAFIVELRVAEGGWFIQSPYEGKRGREDYYAPMSVWALIRAVHVELGPNAPLLDRALALLHPYFLTYPDLFARPSRELRALPDALIAGVFKEP